MNWIFLPVFATFLLFDRCLCDLLNDSDVYVLEQSIDEFEFREIGNINLRLIRQNQNTAQLQSLNSEQQSSSSSASNQKVYTTKLESEDFGDQIRDQIRSSSNSNQALYRLRLCRKSVGSSNVCYASTFTFLRHLINSDFTVYLTVHTNSNNRPNALTIKTPPSSSSPAKSQLSHLTMLASVQNPKPAQQPDTETYLEKVRKEMEIKEKGDQAENQSFFSKYWIYIVPFMVVMLLANMVNPEGAAS
jgi:hypothetical protein